jgi:hypothetical protein
VGELGSLEQGAGAVVLSVLPHAELDERRDDSKVAG